MKSATYATSTPATVQALGYAAVSAQSALSPFSFQRREPTNGRTRFIRVCRVTKL